MRIKDTKRLRFIFDGKVYPLRVKTLNFTERFIVGKLQIGYGHYWLVYQQGSWLFIGNLSLCSQLQQIIIRKIVELQPFSAFSTKIKLKVIEPYKSNLITSAILNKLAKRTI